MRGAFMLMKIAFLDIEEHGDCSVLTFDEDGRKACMVIDGGNGNKGKDALIQYLNEENIETIDLMIGTHLDSDHINGLKIFVSELASQSKKIFSIKNYWGPMPASDADSSRIRAYSFSDKTPESLKMTITSVAQNEDLLESLQKLSPKVTIFHPSLENKPANLFSNLKIDILSPQEQIPSSEFAANVFGSPDSITEGVSIVPGMPISNLLSDWNNKLEALASRAEKTTNNYSIVMMLTPIVGGIPNKDFRILFPGDSEKEVWDRLENDHMEINALILKIPHHGSINGITENAIPLIKPKYAVNMVGQSHGIPDKEPLAYLQKENVEIYCTQRNNTLYRNKKKASACFKLNDCIVAKSRKVQNHVILELDFSRSKNNVLKILSGKPCTHKF